MANYASGIEVPTLTQRVNDHANMLSPATEGQLENMLAAPEKEESTQIAVLAIDSLDGQNLEGFSLRVVEKWQLGQKNWLF